MKTEPTPMQLHHACELRASSWLFDDQIAHEVGIDGNTLRACLRRGMQPGATEVYAGFAEDYIKASNAAEERALTMVQAGGKDWQRAAWWLERWAPRRWGAKVPEAGPKEKVDVADLIEEIAERQRTLAELLAAPPDELVAAMRANKETVLALVASPDEVSIAPGVIQSPDP